MSKIHKITVRDDEARQALREEDYQNIYEHRGKVYRMNFVRGIFFGLGTFTGGTIVVAVVIALLSWLGSTFHFTLIEQLVEVVNSAASH